MITVLIYIGVIVYFIAILASILKPVLFLVTDEGIYSDDIEDHISILLGLLCLILLSAATLFSKLSRTRKLCQVCNYSAY